MNPLIQSHSGTAPETIRNSFCKKPGTNEDDSQSDTHPEAGIFHNHTTQKNGPEDGHDMLTSVGLEPTHPKILPELQQKEKLNSKDDAESRMEYWKEFDWIETLLTETEKQAVKNILLSILTYLPDIDCTLG